MTQAVELQFLNVGEDNDTRRIAVRARDGASPGLVWLGGYRSDMIGTKAEALDTWAAKAGHACCRHDYSGHGESGGKFEDGTISRWVEESLAVFDKYCSTGAHVLVGSSMGAWVALRMVQELVARKQQNRLHGLLLLAPAPDFTHELITPELTPEQLKQLEDKGFVDEVSEYSDEPNIFTRALFEDGERSRVMTGPIETGCPVHIVQGMQDPDVPYQHAMKLAEFLPQNDVTMTLIKDGDHRLSRPQDIDLLLRVVADICQNRTA